MRFVCGIYLKHFRAIRVSSWFLHKLLHRVSLINVKKYSSFPKQHNAFNHFDFRSISLDSKMIVKINFI